jgi:phosphate transport system substrate-binding protein
VQRRFIGLAICAALALALSACGADSSANLKRVTGRVAVDGSQSMKPFNEKAEEVFREVTGDSTTSVLASGDSAALQRLCTGKVDIAAVTRTMSSSERSACAKNGVNYQRLMVAHQAAVVVANKSLDATCLKSSQLDSLWESGSKVDNYGQLGGGLTAAPVSLFGPTASSAAFELFSSTITGKAGDSRSDYKRFDDAQGPAFISAVAADKNALGYFDYAWVRDQLAQVSTVAVDDGSSCVAPTLATIQNHSYQPSRPLYYYFDRASSGPATAVGTFVEVTMANASSFASSYYLVPLTAEQIIDERARWLRETGRYEQITAE